MIVTYYRGWLALGDALVVPAEQRDPHKPWFLWATRHTRRHQWFLATITSGRGSPSWSIMLIGFLQPVSPWATLNHWRISSIHDYITKNYESSLPSVNHQSCAKTENHGSLLCNTTEFAAAPPRSTIMADASNASTVVRSEPQSIVVSTISHPQLLAVIIYHYSSSLLFTCWPSINYT